MIPVALSLLALIILAFCTWQGYRKGLILTAAGVVTIFIAAWAGGMIASHYSEPFSKTLAPIFSGWVTDTETDNAIDEMEKNGGKPFEEYNLNVNSDREALAKTAGDALEKMGFGLLSKTNLLEKVIAETELSVENSDQDITQAFKIAVSDVFLRALASMILSVFGFIVVLLLLTLLAQIVSSIFKVPGLNLIDKIGGPIAGFLYGVLILNVIGWALRYAGFLIPVKDTGLISLFYKFNILTWLLATFKG